MKLGRVKTLFALEDQAARLVICGLVLLLCR